MRSSHALRHRSSTGVEVDLAQYRCDGYAIVRRFLDRNEISEISGALDQLHAEGVAHGRCFRHGNLFYNVARAEEGGEPLVQDTWA